MSTVHENDGAKRGLFQRTSSLQKLKCQAFYPFEVAGSICTKESIKILLETTIISAKQLIQKPVLMLCASVACSVLSKLTGKDVFKSLEKILEECDQVEPQSKSKSYSVIRELKQRRKSCDVDNNSEKQSPIDDNETVNTCSEEDLHKRITDRLQEISPAPKDKVQYKYLTIVVRFSTVFVFAELLFLVYLLSGVYLPIGFVFLFSCLLVIGIMATRISFMRKSVEKRQRRTVGNQLMTSSTNNVDQNMTVKYRPVVHVKPFLRPLAKQQEQTEEIIIKKFI